MCTEFWTSVVTGTDWLQITQQEKYLEDGGGQVRAWKEKNKEVYM